MELTRTEENKNRVISGIITLVIFGVLLLFLILYTLITPNPPFPETGGGGGQQMALGMMNLGNDNIDYGAMGSVNDVVAEKEPTREEDILTDVNGEEVPIKKSKPKKPKKNEAVITPVKNNVTVIKPVKEKSMSEKIAEMAKKNNGKNGGGIGDNGQAGQNGSPDGDPFKKGNGGHGDGNGGGEGDGDGPGSGPGKGPGFGNGKYGVDLKGRAVVKPPQLPKDNKEEGKVVVEITVDKEGNVIEASPNGRGTTTSSTKLKAMAKQAALATKFNINGKFDEQKGTITIIFSFN